MGVQLIFVVEANKGYNKMRTDQVQTVRDTFQSILRADYISISDIKQLESLNDYYVDFFNLLPKVLQNQDSFINGRRGTGKTTLLMRAYYECMKTISPIIKEDSHLLLNVCIRETPPAWTISKVRGTG